MPTQPAIWTVGANPAPLMLGRLASEQQLRSLVACQPICV